MKINFIQIICFICFIFICVSIGVLLFHKPKNPVLKIFEPKTICHKDYIKNLKSNTTLQRFTHKDNIEEFFLLHETVDNKNDVDYSLRFENSYVEIWNPWFSENINLFKLNLEIKKLLESYKSCDNKKSFFFQTHLYFILKKLVISAFNQNEDILLSDKTYKDVILLYLSEKYDKNVRIQIVFDSKKNNVLTYKISIVRIFKDKDFIYDIENDFANIDLKEQKYLYEMKKNKIMHEENILNKIINENNIDIDGFITENYDVKLNFIYEGINEGIIKKDNIRGGEYDIFISNSYIYNLTDIYRKTDFFKRAKKFIDKNKIYNRKI